MLASPEGRTRFGGVSGGRFSFISKAPNYTVMQSTTLAWDRSVAGISGGAENARLPCGQDPVRRGVRLQVLVY